MTDDAIRHLQQQLQDRAHPVTGKVFSCVHMAGASGQYRKTFDIRAQYQRLDITTRFGNRIHQSLAFEQSEGTAHMGLGHIRVDQQHGVVRLKRQ